VKITTVTGPRRTAKSVADVWRGLRWQYDHVWTSSGGAQPESLLALQVP
jgi:hypothetical protein